MVKRSIEQIAAGQLSLITRNQLIALGMSREMISYRAATGHLHKVHPGVYRVHEAQVGFDQTLLAALLAAGFRLGEHTPIRCVVSHRAAALAFGFVGVSANVPEITIPHYRRITLQGVVVHRSRVIDRRDVGLLGPLLVTTPARTLVDLAGVLDFPTLDGAVEDALHRGLTTLDGLRDAFARRGAHRGRGIRGIGDIRVLIQLKERQEAV